VRRSETENSRQSGARKRRRERERERERNHESKRERKERGKERKQAGEEGFALGTRYIDRPYAMLAQWRGVLGR